MQIIKNTISEIVRELAQNPDIKYDQTLLDDGLIDSLTTIELISILEEKFNIQIDSEELNHHNFNTINNIANLIEQKIK